MSLLNKKEGLTEAEFLVKYSLIYLGMKKIKDDSVDKIMNAEENA